MEASCHWRRPGGLFVNLSLFDFPLAGIDGMEYVISRDDALSKICEIEIVTNMYTALRRSSSQAHSTTQLCSRIHTSTIHKKQNSMH